MTGTLLLSLGQVVALTDEAVVLLDVQTRELQFASPRALDILDAPKGTAELVPITDLLDPDDGRLQRFLEDAATVSSPLIARVRRCSDGAALSAKGYRVASPSGKAWIILAFKGDTELSRRFRLLADKIRALDLEIEQRKTAQDMLARNAAALQRTLVAVRQMSEIDTADPAFLDHALDALCAACGTPGAVIVSVDAGQLRVVAATGALADAFDMDAVLNVHGGIARLWSLPEAASTRALRTALQKTMHGARDLPSVAAWPLPIGNAHKAYLLLQDGSDNRDETTILADALSSLMGRARIEADLRHSQKLQAIGELTGGIAHDFNNILAIVLGNAELAIDNVDRFGAGTLEAELVSDIRAAALRGATLTSRLLSFARKQALRPDTLSLNVVLRDLDTLLRRAIGENVDIEMVGAGGLWKTRLDQSQLENALLNLAVNARDAMPDGGRLTIETANTRLDAEYAAQHSEVTAGQYVMVAVTDTGTGMSADVIREAFTPFFTTKGVGQGSGLGLSMVFGFVKQSGGHVKIYSEPGFGTTVKMYFPRDLTDIGSDAGQVPRSFAPRSGAQGHVLVVEDDPAILRYTARTLTVLGYTVDTALTGDAAAALLRANAYDILLTDVVLPGSLNGARVASMAREVLPGIKVLFMSGYTENAIVHNGQLDPGVELITKPFTRDDLARRLENLKAL